MSTRALVPLLLLAATGCDRGELVLLPAHAGARVRLDAAQEPDQAALQPVADSGGPGPPMQFECTSDDHCGSRRSHCDLRTRRCVECLEQRHCQWPLVCDLYAERCALPCQSDVDCSMTAQTRCDPNRHVCVGCTSNSQCGTQFCELWSGQCVECLDDSQCSSPWQFCSPNRNECVECRGDHDCLQGEVCGGGGRCFTP